MYPLLKNWPTLNKGLARCCEEEVLAMLNHERKFGRRSDFLKRLHQRYTALRASRERLEILREAVK